MPLPPLPEKFATVLSRETMQALEPANSVLDQNAPQAKPPKAASGKTGTRAQREAKPDVEASKPANKSSPKPDNKPSAKSINVGKAPAPIAALFKASPGPSAAPQAKQRAAYAEKPAEKTNEKPAAYVPSANATAASTAPPKKASKRKPGALTKLFVLDTNVLMHDPTSLFRFEEHDLYIPMTTLEELDSNKKGMTEVARNARQTSRWMDQLAAASPNSMEDGLPLDSLDNAVGHGAHGKLFFQTKLNDLKLPEGLPQGKADNLILAVVQMLTEQQPGRDVVLVSKDINMRIKARALGLAAEDYTNDKALEDSDVLYTGVLQLPEDFWEQHSKGMESWQQAGSTFYRIKGPLVATLMVNQCVYWESAKGGAPLQARVRELRGNTAVLQTLRDYAHAKYAVWGINARNREQNFAFNLLMDPDVDFVSLTGQAGTGKTLMTLATGLAQVLDDRRYNEIIVTRVTVPVGEDIGFLPGTEEEKMGPWMGALDDNLEVLHQHDSGAGEWGRAATNDLIKSRIKIKSLNFMRGRTFLNKFVIIDEAQNLTPKQMKTLITRAGPGTKVVCLGNLAQIDTPYLTEGSSGLTYVVDRFKGWQHAGHITLARGERSRLADFASEIL